MEILYSYSDKEMQIRHTIDHIPNSEDFPMHAHEFYEIYWFLQGEGRYIVEGTEYPLDTGSLIITRPAESHKLYISPHRAYERMSLSFPAELLLDIDPNLMLLEAFDKRRFGQWNLYTPREFKNRDMHDLLKGMCAHNAPPYERRLAILISLYALLLEIHTVFLIKKQTNMNMIQQDRVISVIEFINTHLSEDLSLQRLCGLAYLSRSQLERLFKASTGSAVAEYVKTKRLLEARRLIRSGEPAGRACLRCGFNDYSAFYRIYKKQFGGSPGEDSP